MYLIEKFKKGDKAPDWLWKIETIDETSVVGYVEFGSDVNIYICEALLLGKGTPEYVVAPDKELGSDEIVAKVKECDNVMIKGQSPNNDGVYIRISIEPIPDYEIQGELKCKIPNTSMN